MRVLLRPPARSDEHEFLALTRASKRARRRWSSPPVTKARFDAYLKRARRDDFEPLLLCRRADGAMLGIFNFSQIFYGAFCSAYLGYWIAEEHEGQGYMSEGLQLVLRHAFKVLKLHRVEANIQPENERSIQLVKRAGFSLEGLSRRYLKINGRWRDHERWALTAEDFKPRR